MSTPNIISSCKNEDKLNSNVEIKIHGSHLNVHRHNRSKSLTINEKSYEVTTFHKSSTISFLPTYETRCKNCKKNYLSSMESSLRGSTNLTLSQSCIYYPSDTKISTIRQHYYPEGGWGWIICLCSTLVQCIIGGLYFSYSFLLHQIIHQFNGVNVIQAVILGAISTCVSLLVSPVISILCHKKSTRLIAILGGLITILGYLFTSFALQFHQLYFSYGVVVGCGISMIRDTSTIMISQYFKRKRELVEIIIFSGMGLGIIVMPIIQTESVTKTNWRIGFSIISGLMMISCLLGIFYRSASLYHPQRRAILHLRTIQETTCNGVKNNNTISLLKYILVRSTTVKILLLGNSLIAFGSMVPFYIFNLEFERNKLDTRNKYILQILLGISSIFGSSSFGLIIVRNSTQCMISRQYLCQLASLMISLAFLAFTVLEDFNGYVLFSCFYGFFYGGYYYSIKMCVLEKVRARNFVRVWGLIQLCQALPIFIGISTT
ncbi:monocarboxylate transporter 12-like, partial [Centruroides sculpturatus]|uniref:monocarboxylate transporter 12-like n=1 Tax=Centruroides sculpturatus TaxID=218467 RepID=UPI000C6D13D3